MTSEESSPFLSHPPSEEWVSTVWGDEWTIRVPSNPPSPPLPNQRGRLRCVYHCIRRSVHGPRLGRAVLYHTFPPPSLVHPCTPGGSRPSSVGREADDVWAWEINPRPSLSHLLVHRQCISPPPTPFTLLVYGDEKSCETAAIAAACVILS